ncbi:MAG: hypothetical protein AMXMBFR42_20970 [Burkholderiales bacterium]
MIGVDEPLGEAPRELAAERRLAGAHQPDEEEIAAVEQHDGIVAGAAMRPAGVRGAPNAEVPRLLDAAVRRGRTSERAAPRAALVSPSRA